MHRLPGPVTTVAGAGSWGDVLPGGGTSTSDGPRNHHWHASTSLDEHFCAASPARRVLAARAWGRTLAQLHRRNHTAPVEQTFVTPVGPYRFVVTAVHAERLTVDASHDLAAACDWLHEHMERRALDARAALAAFLDGYRSDGGAGQLAAVSA